MSASSGNNSRFEQAVSRHSAIVDAALDEFLQHGFAAARVDRIAQRARVAKGTVYLHFKDKEALFDAVIRQEIAARVESALTPMSANIPLREVLEESITSLLRDLVHSRRGELLRMLIGEAGRFPQLADLYFEAVIRPSIAKIRERLQLARDAGELKDSTLLDFPQLIVAPLILGVIWVGLFQHLEPLEIEPMVRAYLRRVTSP